MYHNIDRNPTSSRKSWPYIGYGANGRKYYINKVSRGNWRAAQVISADYTVPYFYAGTLRDISKRLEAI